MIDATTLVLMAFATYRVWRLFAKDEWPPVKWFRERLEDATANDGLRPFVLQGYECPWCLGAWLAAATVAWCDLLIAGGLALPLIQWAAVSCAVGLLADLDD